MGNTPSGEEADNKTSNQNTNMQNRQNPNGASGWQPSQNMAPNTNMNAPNNQPSAPGWSVPPPQQQTPAYNKGREANAQPMQPTAPVASARIYPTPPTYDETMYQNKHPTIGPQNPTASQASIFMPKQIAQPSGIGPMGAAQQYFPQNPAAPQPSMFKPNHGPQQGYVPPQPSGQQFFPQAQPFSQPQKSGVPQFFPQAPTFAQPPQQQPQQFFSQRPVASGNRPAPTASMPFNSASMGLDSGIWVAGHQNALPHNAFKAGHDTDGTPLFICRAAHAGDILPGKVVQSHGCAYVAYAGKEHAKNAFEVLIGDRYRWIQTGNGKIPHNAVEGGRTGGGEKLYIGRANHRNSLTPGKVHPSHNCLYISYGGEEKHFQNYELLVHA